MPPECLPRDEMATYLCYGSDFRKGEIVPPNELRTDAYYAQRRAPTVPQLLRLPAPATSKLLAIETDGHFAEVGKLLELRFPYATAKFVCNESKNVSPRAQKAAAARQPQQRGLCRRHDAHERGGPGLVASRAQPWRLKLKKTAHLCR